MKIRIPGLQNIIDIPFPDGKLPVCTPCKAMFKSREHCRLRDGHTDVSWIKTYVCVILDDSCITQNSNGGLSLVNEDDVQFSARLVSGPPMPLRAKNENFGGTRTPFCTACYEKNNTRHHCREMKRHQMLPWTTVYVLLSAVTRIPKNDRLTVRNKSNDLDVDLKRSVSNISITSNNLIGHNGDDHTMKKMKIDESGNSAINNFTSLAVDPDDIRNVESSGAFLITVENDSSCELQWLACCN
eukprot:CAMPEP_0198271812 /NCGR_PEP_ID=MMETSP1447-20131203/50670_1 /TAXON_ID=420782 /ORGANISM="Chaetoceros dichaeta, Strain CCMP1751" /LENGTH=241 /DNA_ID=CAMNT_0043964621 /DNA_START=117 /DNA_END=842 /DNA_ORIENTATION=+